MKFIFPTLINRYNLVNFVLLLINFIYPFRPNVLKKGMKFKRKPMEQTLYHIATKKEPSRLFFKISRVARLSWIFCVKRVYGFSFRMLTHTPKKNPPHSAKNPLELEYCFAVWISHSSTYPNKRGQEKSYPFLFARGKIRTRDLLVRSQTLYPTGLHAHKTYSNYTKTAPLVNLLVSRVREPTPLTRLHLRGLCPLGLPIHSP